MDDELLVRVGPGPAPDRPVDKRAAIVRAATELFLRHGYQGTRTEQVAAAAAVSKQTVYTQFGDKERLFREIVLGTTATAEAFTEELVTAFADVAGPDDVARTLRAVARRHLAAVLNPQVLALRRLVIGEAARFPDLAATYHRRVPAHVMSVLAERFAGIGIADPEAAASDFAFLVLGRVLDDAMFHPDAVASVDVDATADHAVEVFMLAHVRETGRQGDPFHARAR